MRPRFTCEAVTSNNGIRRFHLVADNGEQRADLFLNAPVEWLEEAEDMRQGNQYRVQILSAVG